MKLLSKYKLSGLVTLGLISIISTSACSIAVPEFVHISSIKLTDDVNKIHLRVTDSNYNNWDLTYDFTSNQLQKPGSERIISEIELRPSLQNYITRLYESQNLTKWELKDSDNNIIFNIELAINASEGVNSPYGYSYFVSEKLNTAYLIVPSTMDDTTNTQYYGNYATVVIAQIDNLENLIYIFDTEWYNDMFSFSTSNELYDDFQLLRLQGNGADCVNSVYYKFDIDNFEMLIQTWAGQSEILDPRSGLLIVSSYQWIEHTSTIEIIDVSGVGDSQTLVIDSEDIQALLEDNPTDSGEFTEILSESISLPVLSLINTTLFLFVIIFIHKKN